MKNIVAVFLLLQSIVFADVTIAVAANASYVVEELTQKFHQLHPNIHTTTTVSSSGKLTSQILYGAPYDIFLSADTFYPEKIYTHQMALQAPKVYAQGSLVLLSIKPRDFSDIPALLSSQHIQRIALANPKTAPYGRAAKEVLTHYKLYTQLRHKYIYGESVGHALTYTLKAADIGFVAESSLKTPQLKHLRYGTQWVRIDPTLYQPILQGAILLKHAKNNHDAHLFYSFIFSKEAKMIFKKYGYTTDE